MGCDSITCDEISLLKEIAKCKKLLRAAKALYYLFNAITSLFKHADNKDELLRLNKTVILNTIEKVQPILGTKRILKSILKCIIGLKKRNVKTLFFNYVNPVIQTNYFLVKSMSLENISLMKGLRIGARFQYIIRPFATKWYFWVLEPGINMLTA